MAGMRRMNVITKVVRCPQMESVRKSQNTAVQLAEDDAAGYSSVRHGYGYPYGYEKQIYKHEHGRIYKKGHKKNNAPGTSYGCGEECDVH